MLHCVLNALEGASLVDAVVVISPDISVGTHLEQHAPHVQFLLHCGDLNEVATYAGHRLAQERYTTMLFVLGDLPILTPHEVDALLESRLTPIVLVPDRHQRGTNAIVLSPPNCFPVFSFGIDSFSKHCRLAEELQLPYRIAQSVGFGWDVDTPEDLSPHLQPCVGKSGS